MKFRTILLFALFFAANIGIHFAAPVRAEETPINSQPCVISTVEPPPETTPTSPPDTLQPAPENIPPILSPALAELELSKILPNPVGSDADGEFIEVKNTGSTGTMAGWILSDNKNKNFTLPDVQIGADSFVSFPFSQTGITLVNSGGTILLKNPQGQIIETLIYPTLSEGSSFVKENGVFKESPTTTAPPTAQTTSTAPVSTITTIPTTQPSATPAPTPATPTFVVGQVRISEALPDPVGSDDAEYIELENTTGTIADLAGWQIDDAVGGSTPYKFPAGTTIQSNGFLVITHAISNLVLNNSGSDDIRLISPDGTVQEVVHYSDALEGKSWTRITDHFDWKTPTPGVANVAVTIAAAAIGAGEAAEAVEAVEDVINTVSIADFADLDDGEEVQLTGVAVFGLGRLSTRTFAVQDADDGSMVQARFTSTPKITITPGEVLAMRGVVRQSGSKKILSIGKDGVTKTGTKQALSFSTFDADADIPLTGTASVALEGEIVRNGGNWLRIKPENNETDMRISLPKVVTFAGITKGENVRVRGVMIWNSSGVPEMLIEKKGYEVVKAVVPEPTTEIKTNNIIEAPMIPEYSDPLPFSKLWFLLGLIPLLLIYGIWKRKQATESAGYSPKNIIIDTPWQPALPDMYPASASGSLAQIDWSSPRG